MTENPHTELNLARKHAITSSPCLGKPASANQHHHQYGIESAGLRGGLSSLLTSSNIKSLGASSQTAAKPQTTCLQLNC